MSDLDTLKSNLETETSRLLELTNLWQGILKNERELFGEEVEGLILSAIGQSKLFVTDKFKQFRDLIKNYETSGENEFRYRITDLSGFWEMIYIQVQDLDTKFTKLNELKNNEWKTIIEIPAKQMLCSIPKIKKPKPLKNDRKMSEQSRKRIQEAKQRMHEMKFSPSKENNTIFDAPNFFQIVSPAKGKISRPT